MIRRLRKWRRSRRFQRAYLILRKEADHHKNASHLMEFHAAGPAMITMRCTGCPDPHPLKGD